MVPFPFLQVVPFPFLQLAIPSAHQIDHRELNRPFHPLVDPWIPSVEAFQLASQRVAARLVVLLQQLTQAKPHPLQVEHQLQLLIQLQLVIPLQMVLPQVLQLVVLPLALLQLVVARQVVATLLRPYFRICLYLCFLIFKL